MTVVEGDRVTLRDDFFSFDAHQWRRDGSDISDGSGLTLSFTAELEMAGSYTLVLSNEAGTATSDPLILTVIPLPTINATPSPGPLEGGSMTLTATLPENADSAARQWFFKGSPLFGETGLTLTRSNLQFGDEGNYSFSASYNNGLPTPRSVKSRSFALKVFRSYDPPTIVVQPQSMSVTAGGAAVFSVGSAGTGPFSYRWFKNEVELPNETNFYLRIDNVQAQDVGNYTVEVSPPQGVSTPVQTSHIAALSITSFPTPDSDANDLVSSARAALAQQSNSGISAANGTLRVALTTDADHPTANFFRAAIRLANLANSASFNDFLDRLGVDGDNRSLYHWTANLPRDASGNIVAPPNVNASEFSDFAKTDLVPEIMAAIANLEQISNPDFTVAITPAEAGFGSPSSSAFASGGGVVVIDQGDLLLARAALSANEFFLRTINSWNLNVVLTYLDALADDDLLNVETVLRDHPELLTINDSSQIAPARQAFEKAVGSYVQGMAIVRSRAPEIVRLFNLDPDESRDEERFRANLLDLEGSLDAMLNVNEYPQFRLRFGHLIDGSSSLRSLAPSFRGDTPIGGFAPDTTLGGSLQALGEPVIIAQPTGLRAPLGQTVTLGVTAVGDAPLTYQWRRNGFLIPDADQPTYSIPSVATDDYALYEVSVSNNHGTAVSSTAAIKRPGKALVVWGLNATQTNPPPSVVDLVAVSAGDRHALALKADGTVISWGDRTDVPFGLQDVVDVEAGDDQSYFLKADGTVIAWGSAMPPPFGLDEVVKVAAGGFHALALRQDGTLTVWGGSSFPGSAGDTVFAASLDNITDIAAGESHNLALRRDGTVVGWGDTSPGFPIGAPHPWAIPGGLKNVKAIAAGDFHSLALLENGTVVAWGANNDNQTTVPPELSGVVDIAAAGNQSLALKADGSVIAWGSVGDIFSPVDSASLVPNGLSGATSISAGGTFALATGSVLLTGGPLDLHVNEGDTATFSVPEIHGEGPFSFQWRFNGASIPGATTPTLSLASVQLAAAGNYSLAISDGVDTVVSRAAKLSVNAANDGFASARPLPGGGARILGSTSMASREPEEPVHAGDPGGRSVWFSWTAPATGSVNVDTIGSGFDTLLAVYQGTEFDNLMLVAADDDGANFNYNSSLTFMAESGESYLIVVDGYGGAGGSLALTLTPNLILQGLVQSTMSGAILEAFGPATSKIVIQSSADLKGWIPVFTNAIPESGILQFNDADAAGQGVRFYRAVTK